MRPALGVNVTVIKDVLSQQKLNMYMLKKSSLNDSFKIKMEGSTVIVNSMISRAEFLCEMSVAIKVYY